MGAVPVAALAQKRPVDSEARYPNKPVRMIVPNPAGGGVDIIARLVGNRLSERLRQAIVVENRPGAGGTIGVGLLTQAPADGHTIGMGVTATLAIAPTLYRRLPYDPLKDLEPVTLIATLPLILAVHPSLPVKSVKDLLGLARARPGQIDYSSGGNGTPPHLAGELFKTLARLNMRHIPYKGGPPAVTAAVSGEVSLMFANALPALPHIKSGRLRALAVTSSKRAGAFPDIPTIAESGIPAYHAVQWYGVIAPAGVPRVIVERLNREIRQVITIDDVKAPLMAEGAELADTTPEQFRQFIEQEMARWGKAIRDSGARID
ncbi:MAG: tripartite tricarboxylate transporter substrate binding protein [Betaproteobacteria bacterium]|nr:tripartite tricarboxylate transporter substrate binding protein [Betaproteobacteria bacterium]